MVVAVLRVTSAIVDLHIRAKAEMERATWCLRRATCLLAPKAEVVTLWAIPCTAVVLVHPTKRPAIIAGNAKVKVRHILIIVETVKLLHTIVGKVRPRLIIVAGK